MENLYEILRDAPKGDEGVILYSPVCCYCKLESVEKNAIKVRCIKSTRNADGIPMLYTFDEYGRMDDNGECLLWHGRHVNSWKNWQLTLLKSGDVVFYKVWDKYFLITKNSNAEDTRVAFDVNGIRFDLPLRYNEIRYATEGEKALFFEKIKANGLIWFKEDEKVAKAVDILRFKADEWYVCKDDYLDDDGKLIFLKDKAYLCTEDGKLAGENGLEKRFGDLDATHGAIYHFRKWDIHDAKDGDFLTATYRDEDNGWKRIVCIFKAHLSGDAMNTHCHVMEGEGRTWLWADEQVQHTQSFKPSTDEDINFFMEEIEKRGYELDSDTHELKHVKIEFAISKGCLFKCIESVSTPDCDDYIKGRFYLSEENGCITDEEGCTDHEWPRDEEPWKYFTPATEEERKEYEVKGNGFKPFDKVVVRLDDRFEWCCDFFSHIDDKGERLQYVCTGDSRYCECLLYNEKTAKLIGTKEKYNI